MRSQDQERSHAWNVPTTDMELESLLPFGLGACAPPQRGLVVALLALHVDALNISRTERGCWRPLTNPLHL